MQINLDIPHKTDVPLLVARRNKLQNKPDLTPEDRKVLSSFNITLNYLNDEYIDWCITQSTFSEMLYLAFQNAVKLINLAYHRLADDQLVQTFYNSFELYQFERSGINALIEKGIDIFGEHPPYERYHDMTETDLFNALEPMVQEELLRQGIKL